MAATPIEYDGIQFYLTGNWLEKRAEDLGIRDRLAGKDVADCPYPEPNALRRAWLSGWNMADNRLRERREART